MPSFYHACCFHWCADTANQTCSALDRITVSKIVDRVLNKVIAQVMSDVSSDTDTALVESKEDNDIDNVVQIVPAKCVKATQRKHISGRKADRKSKYPQSSALNGVPEETVINFSLFCHLRMLFFLNI